MLLLLATKFLLHILLAKTRHLQYKVGTRRESKGSPRQFLPTLTLVVRYLKLALYSHQRWVTSNLMFYAEKTTRRLESFFLYHRDGYLPTFLASFLPVLAFTYSQYMLTAYRLSTLYPLYNRTTNLKRSWTYTMKE